jgi:hypothetical protein
MLPPRQSHRHFNSIALFTEHKMPYTNFLMFGTNDFNLIKNCLRKVDKDELIRLFSSNIISCSKKPLLIN